MSLLWAVLNGILSATLAGILSYKLILWSSSFNFAERLGMGLMGGSVILTIAPLLVSGPTPFDGWATALLRLGAIIYFTGRLHRHRVHRRANGKTKESAIAHAERKRGK